MPPDGQPILLLGDCQTIGGYPKLAHVITVDMPIAAQLRPGDPVHFGEVSLEEAQALYRARERDVRLVPRGRRAANAMSLSVDLNADLGEGAGHDDELLELVTSANIACGFHAGNATMMRASVRAAKERGVAVGAHPSFEDREHFGRRELPVTDDEVFALVVYQLGAFAAVAHSVGVQPQHVKPHGALYNMAARDEAIADAIARAVCAVDPHLLVFAPAASALSRAVEANELTVIREVFADRNYLPTARSSRAIIRRRCCTIRSKRRTASSACCVTTKCWRSTARKCRCTPTRSACMATRRTRCGLRLNCAPASRRPA